MKTNPAVRSLVRIRFIMLCMVFAAIVGLEFHLGASFAARIGQITALQTDSPVAPNMDLGNLMSAFR